MNKRIVYFNFVSRSHAKINPVWHDIYVYSNSDNECSSCCCYVTSVDEKYWSDEDTSRIILVILYSISMYVVVINEIYSCMCGERLATMDYKKCNIFYKSILLGMSLFLIYKNPLYSILCIGLVVFLIIALIKEKLNYRNSFLKKLKRKRRKYALDEWDYASWWSCS